MPICRKQTRSDAAPLCERLNWVHLKVHFDFCFAVWNYCRMRGTADCWLCKLPSSAEEGWRDSLIEAGAPGAKRKRDSAQPQRVVLVKHWILLNSTTRRHLLRLRPIGLALRCGCPPQLRRAVGTPANSFSSFYTAPTVYFFLELLLFR